MGSSVLAGVTFDDADYSGTDGFGYAQNITVSGQTITRFLGTMEAGRIEVTNRAFAASGNSIPYTFDTPTTDSDPGAGKLRLNNATQNTATEIYVDDEDNQGNTVTSRLALYDDSSSTIKGQLTIGVVNDKTKWLDFNVTAYTANSGYSTIAVTPVASSAASPFSASDELVMYFSRTGDKGETGAAGDIAGPVSSTDNALVRWDGTGGNTVQNSSWTLSDAEVLTAGGLFLGRYGIEDYVDAEGNTTGSYSPVIADGLIKTLTLTGDVTVTAPTPTSSYGYVMVFFITQDGTGSRDFIVTSAVSSANSLDPTTMAASAKAVAVLMHDGTNITLEIREVS